MYDFYNGWRAHFRQPDSKIMIYFIAKMEFSSSINRRNGVEMEMVFHYNYIQLLCVLMIHDISNWEMGWNLC